MQAPLFNPMPQIRVHPLGGGTVCYVIDDALREPQHVVAWARQQRGAFRAVDFSAYPGIYLFLTDELLAALAEFFQHHLRGLFDARRLLEVHGHLAMVTVPPSALRPYQSIPHSDRGQLEPWKSIQA